MTAWFSDEDGALKAARAQPLKTFFGAGAAALVGGDFDADGHLDVAYFPYSTTLDVQFDVLLGNGTGAFRTQVEGRLAMDTSPGATRFTLQSVTAADLDGNHRTDLLLILTPGPGQVRRVLSMLSNGDGTFTAQATVHVESTMEQIAIADFNGDGNADVAGFGVARIPDDGRSKLSALAVFLGDGAGGLAPPLMDRADETLKGTALATGDFNGDRRADLILSATTPAPWAYLLRVKLARADGTFESGQDLPITRGSSSLVVGDLDSDGRPDAFSMRMGAFDPEVFRGEGDGTFTSVSAASTSWVSLANGSFYYATGTRLADGHASTTIDMLTSLGGWTGTGTRAPFDAPPLASVAGDYDGDGKLDLLMFAAGHAGESGYACIKLTYYCD